MMYVPRVACSCSKFLLLGALRRLCLGSGACRARESLKNGLDPVMTWRSGISAEMCRHYISASRERGEAVLNSVRHRAAGAIYCRLVGAV
ncbi:hypothetical protein B0H15DRAFT_833993 [Mycena belliarum]|uniref:Secreted protein n=1 Tax=Mycena belliarum TaxID=1033014 RepID=A0AAD6U983_9AGAR|nr:hypothetical protein B0H15DRAFT_833993 [Mycena belliae]